ncbi:rhomboid family intramembrane serine protease [Natrialba sp. INN-245]|uniref:rhomboid family intramembrane serine protease n=1 Tax=Natrialba sp. INN-245 TaxID=2690967 RepID=UPI0013103615|nr:rhomboid family intramembrane serine protease [Natrialba sp. INN-245]MWV41120.1 rhomboid family intramembrane serine protease [Natrialba sp. INN-245]
MLSAVLTVFVLAVLLGSVAVVARLESTDRRFRDVARARLHYGVPWGTLVVLGGVVCVYLFVQDGVTDLYDPVTIPYRAWSYFYPLGIVTSSFSHASFGHLLGNLIAAAVVAPIAEYAWGHYPDGDVPSWRANPWIRAVVIFPLAVVAIGILTSLFALGPVIGFSGLVYAFAGFAIVRYPIPTLVATIGLQGAVVTIYNSIRDPILVYVAQPSPPSSPSWADVAIQGHALGFFIGLVLALALLERRGGRPTAFRVWIAVLLYAFSKGLWQIYWFGEGNTYLLFRGPGVVIVATLAIVITLAVSDTDQHVVPERLERALPDVLSSSEHPHGHGSTDGRRLATPLDRLRGLESKGEHGSTVDRLARVCDIATGARGDGAGRQTGPRSRQVGVVAVLLVLAVLAGMAIPFNVLVLEDDADADRATVEVEDYTVEYVEEADHELVSGIGIEAVEDDAGLTASGVVVSSTERHAWIEAVTSQRLAFSGSETITVGGPGWRETVHVEREGWEPVGNDTVYQVWLWQDGDQPRHVYESEGSQADVLIDDRTVSIVPDDGAFRLSVESLETGDLSTTQVPDENESVDAGGLTFDRQNETVYAVSNGTEVAVASAETYE